MYVSVYVCMYVCMYVHTRTLVVCVCLVLSLSLSLALYQQNQVDVVRICGPIYGISGVYSPYLWPYIVRICGHVLPIFFVLVSIFGYILGIYCQGGAPVFIFFIDARDGTAGGLVGWRMSRASMKKIERASALYHNRPYMAICQLPETCLARPACSLEFVWFARFAHGFGTKSVRSDPPSTRRGRMTVVSINSLK